MAKTSIGLALAALLLSTTAFAQTPTPGYPSRPITIVVPFPPGGLTDPLARAVGQGLSESLKQPVVVDNKAGATGIIAAELVRKAPPDGHMIFMPATGMLSLNPILFAKNPYETRDFAPVTLAVSTPHLLVVPASSPANSVAELVALARSRPSGLSYASQGTATAGHLLGELFRSRTQARFEHVPYKGSGPGLIDTVAGRVDFFFDAIVSAGPFVRDGRLKLLAVASAQRAPQFASVPTMAEAGFPGVELDAAFGFAVVAGTPPAIVRRLNEEIVKALREPTLNRNLVEQGLRVVANTPEEYAAFIQAQRDLLTKVIKDANIRLD